MQPKNLLKTVNQYFGSKSLMAGLGRRVKERREELGMSQDEIARAIGMKQQGVDSIEAGKSRRPRKLLELARALRTTQEWLLRAEGPKDAPAPTSDGPVQSAPLISWINAGNIKKPEHVLGIEDAPTVWAPGLDPKGQWIALRVEGDSMDRISPPDSVIFVDVKDRKLVPNACYVIADEEGGASYKRYRTNPSRWEAVSVAGKYEPYFVEGNRGPRVIGRVKKSVLDM